MMNDQLCLSDKMIGDLADVKPGEEIEVYLRLRRSKMHGYFDVLEPPEMTEKPGETEPPDSEMPMEGMPAGGIPAPVQSLLGKRY